MGYQDSVNGTAVTEAFLDEGSKQQVLNYATAAARNADAALSAACREGIVSYQVDENTLKVQRDATLANVSTIGPVHGAWMSWTPVVVQGATPTLTNLFSRYMRLGRLIIGQFEVSLTSSGTAANLITVSLPVAAAGSDINFYVGQGKIVDSSAANNEADAWLVFNSSTTVKYKIPALSGTVSAPGYLGTTGFTLALATGDVIDGSFMYEAAGDA